MAQKIVAVAVLVAAALAVAAAQGSYAVPFIYSDAHEVLEVLSQQFVPYWELDHLPPGAVVAMTERCPEEFGWGPRLGEHGEQLYFPLGLMVDEGVYHRLAAGRRRPRASRILSADHHRPRRHRHAIEWPAGYTGP